MLPKDGHSDDRQLCGVVNKWQIYPSLATLKIENPLSKLQRKTFMIGHNEKVRRTVCRSTMIAVTCLPWHSVSRDAYDSQCVA